MSCRVPGFEKLFWTAVLAVFVFLCFLLPPAAPWRSRDDAPGAATLITLFPGGLVNATTLEDIEKETTGLRLTKIPASVPVTWRALPNRNAVATTSSKGASTASPASSRRRGAYGGGRKVVVGGGRR